MSVIPTTMKAARFLAPHTEIQVVDVPVPSIAPNEVLIKVLASGLCYGDFVCQHGHFPGFSGHPKTPGHEVIGKIVQRGEKVPQDFQLDLVVGVGWHAGHCLECENCRLGDFGSCVKLTGFPTATGLSRDGGMAEYMSARWDALVMIPKELAARPAETAPLLCAGVTVFTAITEAGLKPGDVVLVQGMGGLGHLAVQYAAKMGMHTIALTTSSSKSKAALELGAKEVLEVDKEATYLARIRELGGGKAIIATSPTANEIGNLLKALGRNGKLIMVGVPFEPVSFNPMDLVVKCGSIVGWIGGTPKSIFQTLNASLSMGVKAVVEEFPLSRSADAYKAIKENKVYFRAVIVPDSK